MRVHELAKKLGLTSKELLAKLHEQGIEAKSHMSALSDGDVERMLKKETSAPAPTTPEVQEPTAPTPPESAPEEKTAPPPAAQPPPEKPAAPAPVDAEKVIQIRGGIVVKDLADQLGLRPNKVISELMRLNILASINQKVDLAIAKEVAEKYGFTVEQEKRGVPTAPKKTVEEEREDQPEDMRPRPPVVTFLGHVDHGKTSLLDKIRDTAVVDGESGGITQHIGAYTVDISGRQITFLDTPGHAAFTAMRARGANLTDIAVIIIAADDGIMPQTREAIMHAKAANVSLMVAINKVDLPAANADRVLQQLQGEGLSPEDWGGETICCQVSAQTGEGIDHLLEMILLQSEVLELRANPDRKAEGYIIEAQLEPGMGPTAHLLVTRGTLKVGDTILCGQHYGRVKALINDHGSKINAAKPSTPVKCLGLSGVPEAGAAFKATANEKAARSIAGTEEQRLKTEQLAAPQKASLDNLFAQLEQDEKLELKLILKADTQGSIEAIAHALNEIESDKVSLNIIASGTGNITDNDVMLASASNAVVMGFHVGKEPGVDSTAKHEGVELRLHSIIYELIDQVRDAMTGLLAPEMRQTVRGTAEIRQVFTVGKSAKVAGCLVIKGTVTPKFKVRVKRDDEVLFEGSILSLKHFQDEVAEVREAQECGIRIDRFTGFDTGDLLEFYEVQAVAQSL